MRLSAAFLHHELRTQGRSLRFRILVVAYAVLGSVPAGLIYAYRSRQFFAIGGATYAAETMTFLPMLMAVFVALLSLDAVTREQDEGAWSTITLTGVSSAGYLLRRWLAVQAIVVPLTALPLAGAAAFAVAAAGGARPSLAPFFWTWLFHVAPFAVAGSTLAIALGTLGGGAINTFLLGGFLLVLLPALLASPLHSAGVSLGNPIGWINLGEFLRGVRRLLQAENTDGYFFTFPIPASESPFDLGVALDQALGGAAPPLGWAAAWLGLAVLYLRRTRPDVRPWRIPPAHPLRTFLATVARLRVRLVPDPNPAPADLAALGLALLALAGAVTLGTLRDLDFRDWAGRRYAAEESGAPAPMHPDVVPGRWIVRGRLGPGDRVAVSVAAEMRNSGSAPRGRLAFTLDPALAVEEAVVEGGRLSFSRVWDRLSLEIDPPLPPGGSRTLRFRLAGRPAEPYNAAGPAGWDFHRQWRRWLLARFAHERPNLTGFYRVPALARRRVDLAASHLFPVPRYRAWTLGEDLAVREESFRPAASLEIDLAVPPDLFLADACGQIVRGGHLAGRCALAPADYAIAGGHYRVLPVPAGHGSTVAVFPPHAALGDLHLGALTRGTAMIQEAWPGLAGTGGNVVLEWPDEFSWDLQGHVTRWTAFWRSSTARTIEVRGRLVLLPETDLIRDRPIEPEHLAAEVIAARLARGRSLDPEDHLVFQHFFRSLALEGLGLGPAGGAVVGGLRPGQEGIVSIPPPKEPWPAIYWEKRFPASVAALTYRAGPETMRGAIDEFLGEVSEKPGRFQELLEVISRRSEAPLDRMLEDLFVTGALPEPVLEEVRFQPSSGGWRVTGKMLNRGAGEALCKVVLTTRLTPAEAMVRASAGQAGAFTLTTPHRPQAVWLDPDQECHRMVSRGAPRDRVYFEGDAR